MDFDEPFLALNEKTQPIQWIEWPTGALVVAGSVWPSLVLLSSPIPSFSVSSKYEFY